MAERPAAERRGDLAGRAVAQRARFELLRGREAWALRRGKVAV